METRRLLARPAAALALAALIAMAFGCRSPQTRVAEHVADLQVEWQEQLERREDLPLKVLEWPEALHLLYAGNLKLFQARTEVTNSQENLRQIFKDLIPSVNLRAGLSKRFGDLSQLSVDDITVSADSFLSVPGLVSFGARVYGARLYLLRAQAAVELTRREQVIELYKLFLEAQDIQAEREHADAQASAAAALEEIDPFTGQMMTAQLDLRELSLRNEAQSLQQRANDLLGTHDYRWSFSTNQLPELPYDSEPLPLENTNRVAQLQMKLAAIELEGARAQLTALRFRRWPDLNIFISGPPLYQRVAGREFFWDASDLRASADLFWWLDTRGAISKQIRQLKRTHYVQRLRLEEEAQDLLDRLVFTQSILQATVERAQQIDFQLDVLRNVPPAQSYAALQQYAEDYRTLLDQQRQIRRELAELETLFWFVDEYAWIDSEVDPISERGGKAPAPASLAELR